MSAFDIRNSLFVDGAFVGSGGRLRGYGPSPDVTGQAVHFDSVTAVYRASPLSGVSDSPTGTVSFWFRAAEQGSVFIPIFGCKVALNGSGYPESSAIGDNILVDATNDGAFCGWWGNDDDNVWSFEDPADVYYDNAWHHILMSWDTDAAVGSRLGQIVHNGSAVTIQVGGDAGVAFDADVDRAGGVVIGKRGFSGATPEPGTGSPAFDIAELYVNLTTRIDLSVPTNVAKFRNPSTGKPVYLGASGEVPTGTAPECYFRVAAGANVSTFSTNLGTGGAFSTAGALTAASTDPF